MQHSFEFHPTFEKVEEFLRLYQSLHNEGQEVTLVCPLPSAFWNTLPGYPDVERNCWLTLQYAIEQMNRTYHLQKSNVRVEVVRLDSKL